MFKNNKVISTLIFSTISAMAYIPSQATSQTALTTDSRQNNQTITCIDSDGDGWGWTGTESCKTGTTSNPIQPTNQRMQSACIDSDGDGWGWDGVASCKVFSTSSDSGSNNIKDITANTSTNSRTTGGTIDSSENMLASIPNNPDVRSQSGCAANHPRDITDLILVTGQSNVTGAETKVSGTLGQWGRVIEFSEPDNPHPRVFAWTVDPRNGNAGTGWKVATLTQSWHDSSPGVGGIARNSFAFHFAKEVVRQDDCRVVGLIVVSEGGKGISHWDTNAPGWNEVVIQVNEALSALGRTSIDGIRESQTGSLTAHVTKLSAVRIIKMITMPRNYIVELQTRLYQTLSEIKHSWIDFARSPGLEKPSRL